MAKNEVVAAGPVTRNQLAEVAIQASIVANSTAMAVELIRSYVTGETTDKARFMADLENLFDDLDSSSDTLENLFDDLTGWTDDDPDIEAS